LLFLRSFNVSRKDLLVEILVPSCGEGVDFADRHELINVCVSHSSTLGLEISDEILENFD
jgi:hypothetical protein